MFFFEKKNQKTFASLEARQGARAAGAKTPPKPKKVFWFFFSKKNCFLPYERPPGGQAAALCRSRRNWKNSTPSRSRRFIICGLITISPTMDAIFGARK